MEDKSVSAPTKSEPCLVTPTTRRASGEIAATAECRGRIWRHSQAKERGYRIVSAEARAANGSHRYK